MQRKSNKKFNTKKKSQAEREIGRNINLSTNQISRLISTNTFIYAGPAAHYSFATTTDQRYYTFLNLIGSSEFINLQSVYQEFRVDKVSILISRVYTNVSSDTQLPILYLNVNTGGSGTNPNNSLIIESPTSRLFSPISNRMEITNYNFSGVSNLGAHVWQLTNGISNILGQLSIGDLGVNATPSSAVWELKVAFTVSYRNPF